MTKDELMNAITQNHPVRIIIGPNAIDVDAVALSDIQESHEPGNDGAQISFRINFWGENNSVQKRQERMEINQKHQEVGFAKPFPRL